MFYCEIDENNVCFHVTENELPLSGSIVKSEEYGLGKVWNNGAWVEPPETEEVTPDEG